jgi:isochorismate synthase EntC
MGAALLESEKDRREHRFVADEVGRKLDGLCRSYRADREVSLLKLARLQHLRRSFEGTLRTGVDDAAIVAALHPTPAVAGIPTAAAVAGIASRDHSAAAGTRARRLGRAARTSPSRSARAAQRSRLALFTGAGIVRAHANAEWEQPENKLAGFVR